MCRPVRRPAAPAHLATTAAEELAWKGLVGLHEVFEDGRNVVHRVGLLDTAKGRGELLNVPHCGAASSKPKSRGRAVCCARS